MSQRPDSPTTDAAPVADADMQYARSPASVRRFSRFKWTTVGLLSLLLLLFLFGLQRGGTGTGQTGAPDPLARGSQRGGAEALGAGGAALAAPSIAITVDGNGRWVVRGVVADATTRDQWLNAIRVGAQAVPVVPELTVGPVAADPGMAARLPILAGVLRERKLSGLRIDRDRVELQGTVLTAVERADLERAVQASLPAGYRLDSRIALAGGGAVGSLASGAAPSLGGTAGEGAGQVAGGTRAQGGSLASGAASGTAGIAGSTSGATGGAGSAGAPGTSAAIGGTAVGGIAAAGSTAGGSAAGGSGSGRAVAGASGGNAGSNAGGTASGSAGGNSGGNSGGNGRGGLPGNAIGSLADGRTGTPAVMAMPGAVQRPASCPRSVEGLAKPVFFRTDADQLDAADRARLQRLGQCLRTGARVRVVGHADVRHTDAYNMALSERRARAVADEIAAGGQARITVVGAGKTQVGRRNDATALQRARRVDIQIR